MPFTKEFVKVESALLAYQTASSSDWIELNRADDDNSKDTWKIEPNVTDLVRNGVINFDQTAAKPRKGPMKKSSAQHIIDYDDVRYRIQIRSWSMRQRYCQGVVIKEERQCSFYFNRV